MPRFQVDIEKRLGTETWTNIYYVEAATSQDAVAPAGAIVVQEQSFHATGVEFTRLRVRSVAVGDEDYQIVPIAQQGQRALLSAVLPLFNVLRCDFTALGGGRPSRKFYRGCIGADDLGADGRLVEGVAAAANTALTALVTNLTGELVDVDGQALIGATVFRVVGMRQLRRGSRRRLEPVLPA